MGQVQYHDGLDQSLNGVCPREKREEKVGTLSIVPSICSLSKLEVQCAYHDIT